MSEKKNVPEINIMRAIAMIAVVLIHSTSSASLQLAPALSLNGFYMFLNKFSIFAVPLFIFISGFVLVYTYKDQPLNKRTILTYYRKRMTNIVVPYFLFSLFYFMLHYKSGAYSAFTSLKMFTFQLLTGSAHSHLYFMVVIIQFYLLFPFLLLLLRNKRLNWHMLWIGAALQWSYYYLNREIIVHMKWLPDAFHRTGSFFLSYLAFFMLGAVIASRFDTFRIWFSANPESGKRSAALWILPSSLWAALGFYYVHINYNGIVYKKWADSVVFQATWFCFTLLSALIIFRLSKWIYNVFPSRVLYLFTQLGASSFGVYFIHPAILMFYRKLTASEDPYLYHLYYAGMFLTALGVSWLVTAFIQKYFAWSWVIFGTASNRRASVNTHH